MIITRTVSSFIKRSNFLPIQKNRGVIINIFNMRGLSTLEITKNLSLLSNEKKSVNVKNLKLSSPQDRPLVVMSTWLMAKKKHINKYAKFYLDYGFDVLSVSISPWQLLWPVKGTQVVAGDILKFLEINESYAPLAVHGFSVGGYQWGEVLVRIAAEKQRYQPLLDRIVGQIWDSAADITEITVGVPFAVFPNNKVMQNALRSYMIYHMKTFDKVATSHYVRASQLFNSNLVSCPALIFVSKKDPIGAVSSNQRARENWERNGMKVTWKCFDDSPHVGHMQKHPDEYIGALTKHMEDIGIVSIREKVQAKL